MTTAAQVMIPALTVGPELSVHELGKRLLRAGADGACVVEDGELVGVVTTMDLVYREKTLHLPTFLTILEAVIPLGRGQVQQELQKISAVEVRQLMTRSPVVASPETTVAEIASLMVDRHLTVVPVMDDDGELVGMVTKPGLLRAVGYAD